MIYMLYRVHFAMDVNQTRNLQRYSFVPVQILLINQQKYPLTYFVHIAVFNYSKYNIISTKIICHNDINVHTVFM